MAILIDLRSVIDEGVGASLSVSGKTNPEENFKSLSRGAISYDCTCPLSYELTFINAGEAVHTSGKVHADLRTACVRCLQDFDLQLDSELEETFFFEATEDEYGDPYPVISDDLKVDIEPMLAEALLVEAPFAPIHDADCQGLCIKCGADLNAGDCGCPEDADDSHPFAGLKDLIK